MRPVPRLVGWLRAGGSGGRSLAAGGGRDRAPRRPASCSSRCALFLAGPGEADARPRARRSRLRSAWSSLAPTIGRFYPSSSSQVPRLLTAGARPVEESAAASRGQVSQAILAVGPAGRAVAAVGFGRALRAPRTGGAESGRAGARGGPLLLAASGSPLEVRYLYALAPRSPVAGRRGGDHRRATADPGGRWPRLGVALQAALAVAAGRRGASASAIGLTTFCAWLHGMTFDGRRLWYSRADVERREDGGPASDPRARLISIFVGAVLLPSLALSYVSIDFGAQAGGEHQGRAGQGRGEDALLRREGPGDDGAGPRRSKRRGPWAPSARGRAARGDPGRPSTKAGLRRRRSSSRCTWKDRRRLREGYRTPARQPRRLPRAAGDAERLRAAGRGPARTRCPGRRRRPQAGIAALQVRLRATCTAP